MKTRKCILMDVKTTWKLGISHTETIDKCEAQFHQWGIELDDNTEPACGVTVAIIELQSGQITTAYPNDIRFVGAPNAN